MTVFNMSWTAAVIIGIVLLLRLALRKAPRRFSYLLWLVVLFRLLCPFTFESVFSLPIFTNPANIPQSALLDADVPISSLPALASETIGDIANGGLGILTVYVGETNTGDPVIVQAVHGQVWPLLLGYVWVIGMGVILLRGVLSYMKLRRRLVGAVRLRDNIWLTDTIETPFVTGLFRPKIYLPSALSEREQAYIILHEQTHIRRGDHVFRLMAFIALCVHWFNPFVRAAFKLSGRDMEMSCDERVLSQLGADIKADYSESLLNLSTGKLALRATPLAFGEGDTTSRVKNVLHYKKPALWVTILAAVGITIAIVFLAMNRAQTQPRGTLAETTVYVTENATQRDFFERMAVITLHPDGKAELRQAPISSYMLPPNIYYAFTDGELHLFASLSSPTAADFYGVKDNDVIAVFRMEPDGALAYVSSPVNLFAGERYVKENPITILPVTEDFVTRHFHAYTFRRTVDSLIVTDLTNAEHTLAAGALDTVFLLDVTGDGTPEIVYYTQEDGGFRLHAIEFTPVITASDNENGIAFIASTDYTTCKRYILAETLAAELALSVESGWLSDADGAPYSLHAGNGTLILNEIGRSFTPPEPSGMPTTPKPTDVSASERPAAVEWDGTELVLPEYPNVAFYWNDNQIFVDKPDNVYAVMEGMPIWNVYLSDVTGDGNLDFCAGISFGSGIIDERVLVYDYAQDALYDLSARTVYDYSLSLENGQLVVTQTDYHDYENVLAMGTLTLEGGRLVLAGGADGSQKAHSSAATTVTTDLTEDEAPRELRYAVTDVLMNDRDAGVRPGVYRTYAGTLLAVEESNAQVTAYLMVLHLGFGYADGAFSELAGSHMPTALTFDTSGGEYTLAEVWYPRDGSYWLPDIKAKFPASAQADAMDTQKFITRHAIQCYAFAIANGEVDTDARIAYLLETICASPSSASNPQTYIDENFFTYRELVYYGQHTLDYRDARLEDGGVTSLAGQILAAACAEIKDAL